MDVKDIIRQKRLELGLTMKELAKKVGVSEGTISRWESGNIENMRRDKVAALSEVLGVSVDILMGWEEKPEPSYYFDEETAKAAQEIFENKELRMLFDATRDADAEDLRALHSMALALKRKERGSND